MLSRNSESEILNLSFKFQIAGRGAESGFWNARAGSWNLFNPLSGLADSHSQASFLHALPLRARAPRCDAAPYNSSTAILKFDLT